MKNSCEPRTERIADFGILPVMHAMDEASEEPLWKLAQLARDLPAVEILALNAFGTDFHSNPVGRRMADRRATRPWP